MSEQTSLTREQKEAIGLLSIGTFLEYFDLMLYVHMAVLLNDLFFEPADPFTSSINVAFAFCSTYLLRPVGALIFGWLGDSIGRKHTVIITTAMMSVSCVIMASLPTYAEIGVTASIVVTICRMVQGMSSMGEIIGASLYITEITKPPIQYPSVSTMSIFCNLGTFAALGIATLVTSAGFNWRIAFYIGAIIAIVGAVARTKLRETPEFADAKRRIKRRFEDANRNAEILEKKPIWKEKVNIKSVIALLLLECGWPVCFYFIYFHCGSILKNQFHYSAEQIIAHNLIISIVQCLKSIMWTYLSRYIYPLILAKFIAIIFTILALMTPYLLNHFNSPSELLIFQCIMVVFVLACTSAWPIFMKNFPVFKRFTWGSLSYAISRAVIYVITSFGFVYLTNYFGNYGILVIVIPTILGFGFGINHFGNLEKAAGDYPEKKKFLSSGNTLKDSA
jgi:MHS family proline/betaine transporter-like MFS transporter